MHSIRYYGDKFQTWYYRHTYLHFVQPLYEPETNLITIKVALLLLTG